MPKPVRAQEAGDVMHAVLSAFLDCSDQSHVGSLVLIHFIENATLIVICAAIIIAQRLGKGDSPRYRALRGLIVGEAVVTLATPEYSFRFPLASATRTRYL